MIRLNRVEFENLQPKFLESEPFNHVVIDDFFTNDIAWKLAEEFPAYDSPKWHVTYDNPIEYHKRICNHWDRFPATTYSVIDFLNSREFCKTLGKLTDFNEVIYSDPGLHGGGWHSHKTGGKLNIHKDYSIHPKLGMQRRLNLIVYLTPGWQSEYGGGLELWSNKPTTNTPLKCEKVIENVFNRAIIFDTAQDSWHGLPNPIMSPQGVYRNSLAMYYLTYPRHNADPRGRALFAPYGEQENDPEVLDLIKRRILPL